MHTVQSMCVLLIATHRSNDAWATFSGCCYFSQAATVGHKNKQAEHDV